MTFEEFRQTLIREFPTLTEVQLEQFRRQNARNAQQDWDELEKSVVAHVADDVKVSIRGRSVEMTIIKKMV